MIYFIVLNRNLIYWTEYWTGCAVLDLWFIWIVNPTHNLKDNLCKAEEEEMYSSTKRKWLRLIGNNLSKKKNTNKICCRRIYTCYHQEILISTLIVSSFIVITKLPAVQMKWSLGVRISSFQRSKLKLCDICKAWSGAPLATNGTSSLLYPSYRDCFHNRFIADITSDELIIFGTQCKKLVGEK